MGTRGLTNDAISPAFGRLRNEAYLFGFRWEELSCCHCEFSSRRVVAYYFREALKGADICCETDIYFLLKGSIASVDQVFFAIRLPVCRSALTLIQNLLASSAYLISVAHIKSTPRP